MEPGRRVVTYRSALALVATSTFVAMLAYAGPLGNTVTLADALRADLRGTTWILSSMSAGLAVTLVTVGVLAERIGRHRVFAVGAVVFAVGSLICAVAGSTGVFIGGRLLEGVGATGMIATGLGLVAALTDTAGQRSATAAWWAVAMGAGIAVGPVATGLLDLVDGWRAFYWLLAAAGAAVAVLTPVLLPRPAGDRERHTSIAGFVLLTVGLGALLAGLVEIRSGSRSVGIGLLLAAVLALAGFVAGLLRGRTALIAPAIVRDRLFLGATVAAFGTGLGVIATMSFSSSFLVRALEQDTLDAGLLLSLWSGTSAVAALGVRRWSHRVTGTTQLAVGLTGTGIGVLLMTGQSVDSSAWQIAPGLLIAGIASGVLNAGLARQSVATVPPGEAAVGTGANNSARYIGASIGVTVVSLLATHPEPADVVAGWNGAVILTGALSLLSALAVVLLGAKPERAARAVSAPSPPARPRPGSPRPGTGPATTGTARRTR